MRHKVTCAMCGKIGTIIVEKGKKMKSKWKYFGKVNVNACQTNKYLYRWRPSTSIDVMIPDNIANTVREKNKCYNPSVKPKYAEYWECPKCGKDQ